MSACPIILTGIELGCKDAIAGIKEVYLIDRTAITGTTVSGSTITAISAGTEKFKVYKFKNQTGMINSVGTFNDANENQFYTNDLTLKFNKLEAAKRTEIEAMSKGRLAAIVKTNAGQYIYLGYDNEVTVTANVATSGTAFGDQNGYQLTLQDISFQLPYFVDGTIIAALIA